MLQWVFGGLAGLSLLWSLASGQGEQAAAAMLKASEEAVQTAIALTGC